MARASLLHYHQSLADPNLYDHNSQLLQPTSAVRQDTSTRSRSQLLGHYYQTLPMAQSFNQRYKSQGGFDHQQWQQYQAYVQPRGAQASQQSSATAFPHEQPWAEGTALNHGFAFSGRSHMAHEIPQLDRSYGNGALVYPESASGLSNSSNGGSAVPWPTPKSLEHSGSARNDAFDRGTNDSLSPKSYNSETQPSEAQPFTPKSIPSAASHIGDWSCGSAQPYVAIKASSPTATPWGTEHHGGVHLSGLRQHELDMNVPMAPSIGPSQGFSGLPATYSDISQHGSDYSYSQQSSPGISPGFHGGSSIGSSLYQSDNLLASSARIYGLPNRGQTRTINDTSTAPTLRCGSYRSVPRRENVQALSDAETAADAHAQRRADDAILLEGKRNGLTYKDIRKRMYKKCAESTLRGRYRALTKARQDRVRKPVWRPKDVELLTDYVTRDLDRIDASFHQSLSNDQRLAKVQWKKIADAIHRNGGSYHFGNTTCKRKWVELNPEL